MILQKNMTSFSVWIQRRLKPEKQAKSELQGALDREWRRRDCQTLNPVTAVKHKLWRSSGDDSLDSTC
ncbi:unnamed protein product [Pleuronectes platessa]|uniref:Uncharacterized protein n=1 Tax=Pleuronectes platessa TaxID=8262 RepID=A0A9N7TZR8_PLEPL|nr:unnamed protein product [Pleuronectes platessa]